MGARSVTPALFLDLAIRPALTLLPQALHSPPAQAMLIAIALQESRLQYRRQLQHGPARGFWQFERGGVAGVLKHPASATLIAHALKTLAYESLLTAEMNRRVIACHTVIEHHDLLACLFARLLLWTLPLPLPGKDAPLAGWEQYLQAWRPGKPHQQTWDGHWAVAWDVVDGKDV